jgi:hypothetical protein
MRLEGSFTRSRVKFCDSPMTLRFVRGLFERSMVGVAAGEDRKRVNLLIFAVAAVVVGIEVADQRTLHNRPHGFFRGMMGGAMKAKLRIPRDLSVRTAAPARRRRS